LKPIKRLVGKQGKYVGRRKKTTKNENWKKYKRNKLQQFYECIRKTRTGFKPRTTTCKNKQGEIVGDEKDELEVWATYFKELPNPKTNMITSEESIYFCPESNIMAPTLQETLGVIRNLKNNRAPGEDSITSELIKYVGRKLRNSFLKLVTTIWDTEQMPQDGGTSIICPVYKQGDKLECRNYRGISLLNVTYKIFTNLLTRYIEPYVEEILGATSAVLEKLDLLQTRYFCLRMILEETCEYKVHIHQLYIDYKQAYDTINRAKLPEIMKEFGL